MAETLPNGSEFRGQVLSELKWLRHDHDQIRELLQAMIHDHDTRIRDNVRDIRQNERDISKAKGVAGMLGIIGGAIAGFLIKKI